MTRQELADRAGVDRKTLYNLFVQNLSVRGGKPVPVDERGIEALVSEKYDK